MSGRDRLQIVDVARGVAFVAMFVYHGTWFATERGLLDVPIRTALGWQLFQRSIAGTFFFLVGFSLYLANRQGIRWRAVGVRLAKLGGCALVVTVASAALQPAWIVTFGILHSIAVCSVVGLAFLRLGPWSALPAAVSVWLGVSVRSELFDPALLRWTGLGTRWVPSFDFQPFFPWFGVVLFGVAAASLAVDRLPRGPVAGGHQLATLGRHTLFLYMAHVPFLIVTAEAFAWALGR